MVEVLRHTEVRSPGPDKQRDWAASVLASGECQLNSANGTASRSEPLCLAAPRKGMSAYDRSAGAYRTRPCVIRDQRDVERPARRAAQQHPGLPRRAGVHRGPRRPSRHSATRIAGRLHACQPRSDWTKRTAVTVEPTSPRPVPA
jgi:hypothetical protein